MNTTNTGNIVLTTYPTVTATMGPNLAAAFVKAQASIGAAKKGNANPFFKSKYADLGSVMEACKEALNENGIAVLQPVSTDGASHFVKTVLVHTSGETYSETMKIELGKVDMQQLGSAITYARRYSLQSMLFIPAEDDDAESTMNRAAKAPVQNSTASPNAAITTSKPSSFKPVGKAAAAPAAESW